MITNFLKDWRKKRRSATEPPEIVENILYNVYGDEDGTAMFDEIAAWHRMEEAQKHARRIPKNVG